jgi:hypothetical protein
MTDSPQDGAMDPSKSLREELWKSAVHDQLSNAEMPEPYRDLFRLYDELEKEVDTLVKESSRAASGHISSVPAVERRVIVRSAFAFIEATVYSLKNIVAKSPRMTLHHKDLMMTSEFTYDLSESGEIKKRRAKLRLAPNVRYAFKLFKQHFGVSYELDVGGQEWQFFLKSIKVRDRITHPKQLSDLSISDNELIEVFVVTDWFTFNFGEIMAQSVEKLLEKLTAKRNQRS